MDLISATDFFCCGPMEGSGGGRGGATVGGANVRREREWRKGGEREGRREK